VIIQIDRTFWINGLWKRVANAYSELNDPLIQRDVWRSNALEKVMTKQKRYYWWRFLESIGIWYATYVWIRNWNGSFNDVLTNNSSIQKYCCFHKCVLRKNKLKLSLKDEKINCFLQVNNNQMEFGLLKINQNWIGKKNGIKYEKFSSLGMTEVVALMAM
jgi:lysyl-tRNA synthetase class 2